MKRWCVILSCPAIACAALVSFAQAAEPLSFRSVERSFSVETRDWEGKPTICSLLLRWPEPNGGPAPLADSIRAVIAEWVFGVQRGEATLESLADEAGKNPLRMLADPSTGLPHAEVERSIDVAFDSLGIVSLNAYTYVRDEGAHGIHGWACYNLERNTGNRLTLSELFADGARDSLLEIGERAFRRDKQVPEGQSLVDAGFWTLGHFRLGSSFHPTSRGIEFQYRDSADTRDGPGPSPFTIPWSELRPLLRPDGPLAAIDP
jgi:hypothetical protein